MFHFDISTIIFSFIDALFFLIAEEDIQSKINKISFMDPDSSEIATGAISASISIFAATLVRIQLSKKYDLIENPFLDALGILIGTIIFISLYILIKKKWKLKVRRKKNIKQT